jgi:signal transduction histidine kinase/ligand-binding sensor domain-containing protein
VRRADWIARLVLATAVAAAATPTLAKFRVMRVLDWRSGLPTSYVGSVEQDPEGFLWISSAGGVFRYDGAEMLRRTSPWVGVVRGSATAGRPLLFRPRGAEMDLLELDQSPLRGPDGAAVQSGSAHMTPDGALWCLDAHRVRRRAPDGTWSAAFPAPSGAELRSPMSSGRDGTLLVPGGDGLYRVDRSGRFEPVASLRGVLCAIDRPDGSTIVGCFRKDGGHVYEARGSSIREIDSGPRLMSLAMRGDALWIAYDDHLERIVPGQPRESITLLDGLPSGGTMLVDREGSLWVATFRGLVQFPEPETVAWWAEAHTVGRNVARAQGDVWMSSWGGMYRASLKENGWELTRMPEAHINAPCVDASGAVWTATGGGFAVFRDGEPARRVPAGPISNAGRCAAAPDGALWFPTDAGLYLLDPRATQPRLVAPLEPEGSTFDLVYEDSRGMLWGSRDLEVCAASASAVRAGHGVAWSCETRAEGLRINGLLEMPSGRLWATTADSGVLERAAGGWRPIAGSLNLPSELTVGPVPSPLGGVWIVGEGVFLRVRERTDLSEGWEVLERIGVWQGLPTSGTTDVVEDPDGTLWSATNQGLVRIPPEARHARPEPPPVALVETTIDGRRLDVTPGRVIELPHRRNRLELRFTALSYREQNLIRYRSRLHPGDAWSPPTTRPYFRFVDLPPGGYRVEVESSLDGERWSRATSAVAFAVLRPWYAAWWFFALLAASLAAALGLGYRLRVAQLLRLERQRTRIAMDLHDAIGSGLGSIRILAGLAARGQTPEDKRVEISSRIASVAGELASSLGDIVWSLKVGSATLGSLSAQIVQRGAPLFAGDDSTFATRFPSPWPDVKLSLAVRRHVFLIALEALHNASKHARARGVTVAIEPAGRRWRLLVEDDGRGMAEPPASDSGAGGVGLDSIRKRAAEIGAEAAWAPRPGGGTVFRLEFLPGAEDRRLAGIAVSHDRATDGRDDGAP